MANSSKFFFCCLKGTFKSLSQSGDRGPVLCLHWQRALPRTNFLGSLALYEINKKKESDQMAVSLKKKPNPTASSHARMWT